jgi:hypothetical protein
MGSYYCPAREYSDFKHEFNVADPDCPDLRATPDSTIVAEPRRAVTSAIHRMGNLLLIAICVASAVIPSVASAARFKTCKTVRVDLGIMVASVSERNTSCRFARDFVRRHRRELCSLSKPTIEGWRKSIRGTGEDFICTLLHKGSKAIRTDACGA